MKRVWLILLSLGLMGSWVVPATALDVKVSGEYYAAGMYLNKVKVANSEPNPSTAFFYQRLRVGTDFIVDPSLKLVTRFDVLERVWGGDRTAPGTALAADSAGTIAENQNIAIDWAYITYKSPIGTFDAGIMTDGSTGTIFGNSYQPLPRIKYAYDITPDLKLSLSYTKVKDQSKTAYVGAIPAFTDGDNDNYSITGEYKWKNGRAGLDAKYYRYADKRPTADNYLRTYWRIIPYAIAKIGPVNVQTELMYAIGNDKKYDRPDADPAHIDTKMESLAGWIDATATFAPVYVGATLAYVSGDDPDTKDKNEGTLNGGRDWNPCLIMFNTYDVGNWAGAVNGFNNSVVTGPMRNAWFYQGRVGAKPIPALDAMLSVSYASADKKPAGFTKSDYGVEVDLTATYKITNNLSYMFGVGYLFTGDYFKGKDATNEIKDNYLVMNKLTLTF